MDVADLVAHLIDEEDVHLSKIAVATRYLYRCRRAGETRTTAVLLRELVSENDAAELETAIARFFLGGERLP